MPDADQDPKPQPHEEEAAGRRRFGTFGGVFTPTLLTILGVIMYLRTGWVMGNAGILGGLLIILFSFAIAGLTGLCMSSIATNVRIGAGGAYAIIAQSLGLEVGGAVGIPRYLSQALAVTMYLFGFREGWLYVFPEHPTLLVDLGTFLLLFGIAYVSADLAIKVQYLILAIVVGSLLSILIAALNGSMQYPVTNVGWWGSFAGSPENNFAGTDFWVVFAVFFPASTGIMAGANMSGDLKNPMRSIPVGTMWAIGVSLLVYLGLAYWLVRSATPEELTHNYYVAIEKAFWSPVVAAGLLGACFSSALASIVGAARILQALGDHDILPGAGWLARQNDAGEPRNAMLITGGIVFGTLLLRDLNAVAPLITMFFLITYVMINAVLLIEQSLGLVSFRPLLRLHPSIALLGTLSCLFTMFIIYPIFSLIALAVVVAFYFVLIRRHLEAPFEDVRSGLFVSLAEWAATKVKDLPTMQERAWKPNILVPIEDAGELRGTFLILQNIAHPEGSIKIIGLNQNRHSDKLSERLHSLTYAFREKDVFSSYTVINAGGYEEGLIAGMQALRGAFFKANTLFLSMPGTEKREDEYRQIVDEAETEQLGILLYAPHPKAALGRRRHVNVWIHDRSPDWRISMDIGNLNLSILAGYKLKKNWNATLRLIMVVEDEADEENARTFLKGLTDRARLPDTEIVVASGGFGDYVPRAPLADLNIFGLLEEPDFDFVRRMVEETRSTCLFVRDSGTESALA